MLKCHIPSWYWSSTAVQGSYGLPGHKHAYREPAIQCLWCLQDIAEKRRGTPAAQHHEVPLEQLSTALASVWVRCGGDPGSVNQVLVLSSPLQWPFLAGARWSLQMSVGESRVHRRLSKMKLPHMNSHVLKSYSWNYVQNLRLCRPRGGFWTH